MLKRLKITRRTLFFKHWLIFNTWNSYIQDKKKIANCWLQARDNALRQKNWKLNWKRVLFLIKKKKHSCRNTNLLVLRNSPSQDVAKAWNGGGRKSLQFYKYWRHFFFLHFVNRIAILWEAAQNILLSTHCQIFNFYLNHDM